MTDNDSLNQAVVRGEQAKGLVQHEGFQLLMSTLAGDKSQAAYELTVVDAEDAKAIRNLQNIIFRHDELVARLSVLIEDGDIAQHEISGDNY